MLKDTGEHRLGTGYAQGGILSKLLGIEVFRHYWAIAATGYEDYIRVQPQHKHIKDLRERTDTYTNYYYYFLLLYSLWWNTTEE